jgi:hypothetical protein
MKLRQLFHEDELRELSGTPKLTFTDATVNFLQNIQNCAHNSLWYKLTKDDLQSVTQPFDAKGDGTCSEHDVSKEDDEYEEMSYELFMEHCDILHADDTNASLFPEQLQNYSFKPIRHAGFHGCGFSKYIPSIQVCNDVWLDREWVLYDHSYQSGRAATPVYSGFKKKGVAE